MNRLALLAVAALVAPLGISTATIAVQGGGPHDVTSDTLLTGIVQSSADGSGSYILEFFTPGRKVTAIADAAVTQATIASSFTGRTISRIDGLNLNTLVSAAGVDILTTVFDTSYPVQQLRLDWANSGAQAGFRFDVETWPVPLPTSILLPLSAVGGLGVLRNRRKTAGHVVA